MVMKKSKIDIEILDNDKLIPDQTNANKHSEYGMHIVEKSIRQFGFVEAGLLSEDNVICSGNARNEVSASIGLNNVKIIDIDGTEQVYLRKKGLKSNTKEFHELALALNASAKANITWDNESLEKLKMDFDIDTVAWGVDLEKTITEIEQDELKEPEKKMCPHCGKEI